MTAKQRRVDYAHRRLNIAARVVNAVAVVVLTLAAIGDALAGVFWQVAILAVLATVNGWAFWINTQIAARKRSQAVAEHQRDMDALQREIDTVSLADVVAEAERKAEREFRGDGPSGRRRAVRDRSCGYGYCRIHDGINYHD